jgi:hypothetical protein
MQSLPLHGAFLRGARSSDERFVVFFLFLVFFFFLVGCAGSGFTIRQQTFGCAPSSSPSRGSSPASKALRSSGLMSLAASARSSSAGAPASRRSRRRALLPSWSRNSMTSII